MNTFALRLSAVVPALALLAACGGAPARPGAPSQGVGATSEAPVLTHSLYSKDSAGSLTESDLQKILESPIDLQLPARVGVVPLAEPFSPKGPVALATRHIASSDLASALVGAPYFSQVSDISTDIPNVGGIEGLRVIAARYRVRYLVLYSQKFEDATHLNGWAWLYPTVIGMFLAPGVTVQSNGIAQADLVDVRTGTILFSLVEPIHVSSKEMMIGAGRAHGEAQGAAASLAAKALAKRVIAQTNALVAFAEQGEKGQANVKVRIIPAPIEAASTTAVAK
jgi:rhombotail lipoprotein